MRPLGNFRGYGSGSNFQGISQGPFDEQGGGVRAPVERGRGGQGILGSFDDIKKPTKVKKSGVYKLKEGEEVKPKKEKGAKKVLGGKSKKAKRHVKEMHIR